MRGTCGGPLPAGPTRVAQALRDEAARAGHEVAPLAAPDPEGRRLRLHVRPAGPGQAHRAHQVVATVALHPRGSVLSVAPVDPEVTEVWTEHELTLVRELVARVRRRWR